MGKIINVRKITSVGERKKRALNPFLLDFTFLFIESFFVPDVLNIFLYRLVILFFNTQQIQISKRFPF
jgi:hypothetical protein